jgi:cysteinyl-tRNA synthetase
MSTKHLGQPFDIHTGGIDLKFPHHENEIAQSRSAAGKDLANYFVHGEYLIVNGKKMAKRKKNFYTIEDIIAKGFHPMAFRLLVLQAHYRTQLNFTWESLKAAQEFLQKLYAWADLQFQTSGTDSLDSEKLEQDVTRAINSDLSTPQVLSILNAYIARSEKKGVETTSLKTVVNYLDQVLGLGLSQRLDIGSSQKALITKREAARQNEDYGASDRIRDELKAQCIGLNDNSYGVTWYRII